MAADEDEVGKWRFISDNTISIKRENEVFEFFVSNQNLVLINPVKCPPWSCYYLHAIGEKSSGSIEFMGLWKDSGDRAMPVRMGVTGQKTNIKPAFESLIAEMKSKGVTIGFIAA